MKLGANQVIIIVLIICFAVGTGACAPGTREWKATQRIAVPRGPMTDYVPYSMQMYHGAFRIDDDSQVRSMEALIMQKRVRRRLTSVMRRLGADAGEDIEIDDDILTSLNEFMQKVRSADLRDLYDIDIWPDMYEAEKARQGALERLRLVQEKWKASLPSQSSRTQRKMAIDALLN